MWRRISALATQLKLVRYIHVNQGYLNRLPFYLYRTYAKNSQTLILLCVSPKAVIIKHRWTQINADNFLLRQTRKRYKGVLQYAPTPELLLFSFNYLVRPSYLFGSFFSFLSLGSFLGFLASLLPFFSLDMMMLLLS
jgi:hypothetical protein